MDYKSEAKKFEKQFKEDLKQLVSIPSLRDDSTAEKNAPFGKACRQALDKAMEIGEKAGFHVRDVDGYACVIEYGDQEESIGVLAHLDIVPIGDGWSHDPLGCEEKNGYIFGRGVLDDKGPLVAALTAMRILKENNIKLNKKIQLICGCDEESGMQCMRYYTQHEKLPVASFTPDANFPVIYGEKGILCMVIHSSIKTPIVSMKAGERMNVVIGKADALLKDFHYEKEFEFYLKSHGLTGKIEYEENLAHLYVNGTSAHASIPWQGVNAGLHLLNFVGCAYHIDALSQTAQILMDVRGERAGMGIEGAYMGPLTLNAGIISADESSVKITLDIRYPNDTNEEKIKEGFTTVLQESHLPFEIIETDNTDPLFLNPNSEFIQKLMKVYRQYSNDDFTPAITIGGGTYAKKLPNCVAFGPEFPNPAKTDMIIGGPHAADEAINLDEMMSAIAIYAAALEELAS